jgi:hypothetical protein
LCHLLDHSGVVPQELKLLRKEGFAGARRENLVEHFLKESLAFFGGAWGSGSRIQGLGFGVWGFRI